MGYGFTSFVYTIVEGGEHFNPYDNRTAVAPSARKLKNGQFTGSLDTLQAKCITGINDISIVNTRLCPINIHTSLWLILGRKEHHLLTVCPIEEAISYRTFQTRAWPWCSLFFTLALYIAIVSLKNNENNNKRKHWHIHPNKDGRSVFYVYSFPYYITIFTS